MRPVCCVLFVLWALVASPLVSSAKATAAQGEAAGPSQDPFEGRTVLSLAIEGANRYSEERLLAALGLSVGEPFKGAIAEKGIDYLWTLFQVRAELTTNPSPEGLDLLLKVVELPSDLEPRFIGYDEISLEKILEWAQLEDRKELYFHQVPRVAERLIEGYRREGHYFVEVTPVIREPKPGDDPDATGDVIFEIIEGPQVNVQELVIHGNQSLPDTGVLFWDDGLQHLAQNVTEGPSLFDWNGAEFVEEEVNSDLVAMRNVYRERGYLNAVVELDRKDFSDDRSWVTLHVIVDEGPRFKVTEVNIEAFDLIPSPKGPRYLPSEVPAELVFPMEELKADLKLKPEEFYLQVSVLNDRYTLRNLYGKDGYIEHASLGDKLSWKWMDPGLEFDLEKAEVKVTYRISQGRQIRIREVLIGGATHTRDHVIRRDISIDPGEFADMDQIISSVRRLNRTNYFSDERDPLGHRDPYFIFKPTEEDGWVDIDFIVEEGRVVDFSLQGGVDSNNGLFGLISLSMNNFDLFDPPDSFLGSFGEIYRKEAFHGGGQRLTLQVSPGAERDQSQIVFVEPDIFGLHRNRWSMTNEASIFERRFTFYDERRKTLRASFGRQLGYDSGLSLGLLAREIRVDRLTDTATFDEELFSLQQQEGVSQLRSFSFGLNNRTTDAGLNPKSGRILSWKTEVATEALDSDWEFWNSDLSWDEYIPLSDPERGVPSGFRVSAAVGVVVPFGNTEVVPYSERLFLGGFNSLRGFRFRGVGPNSAAGNVLGGESMARLSLEYRYPLVTQTNPGSFEQIEMFRMHFFVDAGVLGTAYDRLDLAEQRSSLGFGFALLYPVPLAFNFAWPMEEGFGDRTEVFSFNIAIK